MENLEKNLERLEASEEIYAVVFPTDYEGVNIQESMMRFCRDRNGEYFLYLEINEEGEDEPHFIAFRDLNDEEKTQMRKLLWITKQSKEWVSYAKENNN